MRLADRICLTYAHNFYESDSSLDRIQYWKEMMSETSLYQ